MNVVQLGANSGNDHVSDFIREYSDQINKVLLVEPISVVADECREYYKDFKNDITVHACAVSNKNGTAELTYIPGTNLRLSSMVPGLHSDFMNPKTTTMTVPTLTFDSLFAKHELKQVDVLFVDCEGIDEDLLINYDFAKYNTGYVCWEFNHSQRRNPQQHQQLIDKLMSIGGIIENRGTNKIFRTFTTENYKNTLR